MRIGLTIAIAGAMMLGACGSKPAGWVAEPSASAEASAAASVAVPSAAVSTSAAPSRPASAAHTVIFEITSTGPAGDVAGRWGIGDRSAPEQQGKGPYPNQFRKQVIVNKASFKAFIHVQGDKAANKVSCKITVDGVVKASFTSTEGSWKLAICDAAF
ncbi:MAG TPA: hypothetical protein DGG94_00790 [Micromonosporaceae bacterium]|nr:hypothetical protein [Micromonosporaceae bacterium]HCU48368.1 hypothetical protein [Micromonosporaceae bacterium]